MLFVAPRVQVTEVLHLIRMTDYDKRKFDAEDAAEAHGRLYTGAAKAAVPAVVKPSPAEQREAALKSVAAQEAKRFEWFHRIYPPLEFDEVCMMLHNGFFVARLRLAP